MATRIPIDGRDIAHVVNHRLTLHPATLGSVDILAGLVPSKMLFWESSQNGSTIRSISADYFRGWDLWVSIDALKKACSKCVNNLCREHQLRGEQPIASLPPQDYQGASKVTISLPVGPGDACMSITKPQSLVSVPTWTKDLILMQLSEVTCVCYCNHNASSHNSYNSPLNHYYSDIRLPITGAIILTLYAYPIIQHNRTKLS